MLKIIGNDLRIMSRDKSVLFWALVFPIILVMLLGNALKSQFPTRENINHYFQGITIEYASNADEGVTKSFEQFLQTIEDQMDISYSFTSNIDESMKKVRNKEITLAVEIISNSQFVVTKNRTLKSKIAENVVQLYVDKYNLLEIVRKEGVPALINDVYDSLYEHQEYTHYETFNKEGRDISAMDYYGIANVFAMMFWMMTNMLPLFNHEREIGLLGRIRISGISKCSYLLSKYVSMAAFLFLEAIILLVFNKIFLNVYIGENVPKLILLLASSVLSVSAIATFIMAVFTKLDKGIGLLNGIVPVVVFLGGGIMPILDFSTGSGLNGIAQYTPLFIHNRSAFTLINGGGTVIVNQGFIVNAILSVVLLSAAIIIYNRKEVRGV